MLLIKRLGQIVDTITADKLTDKGTHYEYTMTASDEFLHEEITTCYWVNYNES